MKILIGSTDYILEQTKNIKTACFKTAHIPLNNLAERAAFLKQTPTLGMFVPCDEDGNVLEEPDHLNYKHINGFNEIVFISQSKQNKYHSDCDEYQKAQSKVIFKGFEVKYFDLGGGEITSKSSFEIIKGDLQICVYKAIPNYFIWNKFKTIEDLVPYNLEMV